MILNYIYLTAFDMLPDNMIFFNYQTVLDKIVQPFLFPNYRNIMFGTLTVLYLVSISKICPTVLGITVSAFMA